MDISLILNDNELELLQKYASKYNMSVSDFVKDILLERIKDEKDMEVYEDAMRTYKKPSVTFRYKFAGTD